MLRSAATVLLASAPIVAAAPAQAAAQQNFPCGVNLSTVSSQLTTTVSIGVTCDQERTVSVHITDGDGSVRLSAQKTVEAGVEGTFTATLPRTTGVCATLETDGASTQIGDC
ncbi:hypothetical protein [Streptomyces sp. DH10]|uniref:hypothetical protein n=1 Tax=Streptomyces sp. DH10 TaxID=3040121 RepID=UPI002441DC0B|nr:hypothetical protein [Streptomyces sp. DH10]MDG9713985.1 hypothetical protein [Streptomyces sp. DH10]